MNLSIKATARGAVATGKAPAVVQSNLDRFVTEATLVLDGEVKKRTPQGVYGAQGGLIGSIQHEIRGRGTPIVKGMVMTAQKYAEVIEKGRRPGKGMPPRGTLLRWLEVKLGLGEAEAQRVEFAVRRSIGIKGFEGRHMFEKAVSENQGRLDQMARACGLAITTELTQ